MVCIACTDDVVCMKGEMELDEYVMNDGGRIFSGNYKKIKSKPWDYGQVNIYLLYLNMIVNLEV